MNMNRYDTHIDRDEIKISVIVPVYNVEKYLRKAVDSILSQTLTELELFLVDDGSTDSCGKICDSYAAEDSRVKVIHKENGGAPSARNMALDRACGKYVFEDLKDPSTASASMNLSMECSMIRNTVLFGIQINTLNRHK